ncbi:MAG: DUF2188 domain-containing protein [Phycisphaerales bacterium]
MAERVTYHVMPGEGGGWSVRQVNSGQIVSSHRSKIDAILRGRELAQSHEYSLLAVHDREGRLERQYTYGWDSSLFPERRGSKGAKA